MIYEFSFLSRTEIPYHKKTTACFPRGDNFLVELNGGRVGGGGGVGETDGVGLENGDPLFFPPNLRTYPGLSI
jgi:hypothetical protein